jgi:iron complex transport system substrate-binding protein
MKQRILSLLLALVLCAALFTACSASGQTADENSFVFTDSAGREVVLPKESTRVAPSGWVATMILATLAPEYLVSVSSTPSSNQYKYLPQELLMLPTTGQMYGAKSTINLEALLDAKPQVIIDLGDRKDGIDEDMDLLQKQTGTPVIFIEADLAHMAQAYRALGAILADKSDKAERIAAFIDDTVETATRNAARIGESDRVGVMYTSGTTGLNTNARGSLQSQVIDLIGADNDIVVEEVSDRGGGNTISMEQLYIFQPDVILFAGGSIYDRVGEDPVWRELSAIRDGDYYEIPNVPYNWLSNPPSVNMVLGIWWLGNLLYPGIYDCDMTEKTREYYSLFFGYDMSEEEARDILANSTLKARARE